MKSALCQRLPFVHHSAPENLFLFFFFVFFFGITVCCGCELVRVGEVKFGEQSLAESQGFFFCARSYTLVNSVPPQFPRAGLNVCVSAVLR